MYVCMYHLSICPSISWMNVSRMSRSYKQQTPHLNVGKRSTVIPHHLISQHTCKTIPGLSKLSLKRGRGGTISSPLNKAAICNSNGGVEGEIWGGDNKEDSVVYEKTLRLVECSMFASIVALPYFFSNSLALQNYFGFFFPLPIVISSMRWGIAAGRKNMVATAMLLLVLSDPIKALTYLLTYGLVGLAMGALWRLGTNWVLSVILCTFVRAFGAIGYVLITSFLIKENILALITINIHTSLTFIITSLGINAIPSMGTIYTIFGTLLMLNCGFSMFLLHILYGVLFVKLGLKGSLNLPRWLEKAL